jgi:sigma-B regulation protein RsbU (phosphoserine phosphatase)
VETSSRSCPHGEGGLLVVVGDVAGKGLPAAMLVSVLVGAIRATADRTNNPEEVLASLNERLVGRGGSGFSTALAAHICSNGTVRLRMPAIFPRTSMEGKWNSPARCRWVS